MYVLWDIIDDTIERKANGSDASAFAQICGCFPSQGSHLSVLSHSRIVEKLTPRAVWGVIWLIQALIMFAAGVIVGLVAFKQSSSQQASDAHHILPVPGAPSAAHANVAVAPWLALFVAMVGAALGAVDMW
jgi:hypothetical protein